MSGEKQLRVIFNFRLHRNNLLTSDISSTHFLYRRIYTNLLYSYTGTVQTRRHCLSDLATIPVELKFMAFAAHRDTIHLNHFIQTKLAVSLVGIPTCVLCIELILWSYAGFAPFIRIYSTLDSDGGAAFKWGYLKVNNPNIWSTSI